MDGWQFASEYVHRRPEILGNNWPAEEVMEKMETEKDFRETLHCGTLYEQTAIHPQYTEDESHDEEPDGWVVAVNSGGAAAACESGTILFAVTNCCLINHQSVSRPVGLLVR